MKKLWISLITLMTSSALQALPLGNPWEASLYTDGIWFEGECPSYWEASSNWCDAWSVRIGFYGDFVIDRRMQLDKKADRARLRSTRVTTEAAYLVFNVWDRVDLFGTLGGTHIRIDTPEKSFGGLAANDYAHLDTDTAFSWSLGGRATLWECGCLGVGAEAQYFCSRPHINFTSQDASDIRYAPSNVHLKYREWQIGFGASYRINIICDGTALLPYAGIKFGRPTMTADNYRVAADNHTFFNLEGDRTWGYAIGITLLGCNKISLAAEARFNDETAIYVNSQFRF